MNAVHAYKQLYTHDITEHEVFNRHINRLQVQTTVEDQPVQAGICVLTRKGPFISQYVMTWGS